MSIAFARILAAGSATLAGVLLSLPASAATRTMSLQQNGTGACQVALPTYESLIRRRPLAIQNEGTSAAFVTCSPPTFQGLTANDTFGYSFRIVNRSSVSLSISCTAVIGSDGVSSPAPVFLTKSVNVGGNSSGLLTWLSLEGYDTTVPFNVSCSLPPAVGISLIETNQTLDVGN